MGIRIDKKRSDSYIGTFYNGCVHDVLELEELKLMIRNMNKSLRDANLDYQFRVKLKGEKAKPLNTAKYVDAYVLRRN
jgi:hypothetical protein